VSDWKQEEVDELGTVLVKTAIEHGRKAWWDGIWLGFFLGWIAASALISLVLVAIKLMGG
jgi:hypothetical protein